MLSMDHENLLDLSKVRYKTSEDIGAFYVKFRESVCNLLKKKGDRIDFLDNEELIEDEVLSPTFEDMIVLWCLEKIDPELPKFVKEMYGEQLDRDCTLKGLQKEIFSTFTDSDVVKNLVENRDDTKSKVIKKEKNDFDEVILVKRETTVIKSEVDPSGNEDDLLQVELDEVKLDEVKENGRYYFMNDFFDDDDDGGGGGDDDEDPEYDGATDGYRCNICGKSFTTSLKLYYHKRYHKPAKMEQVECEVCHKKFDTKRKLIAHRSKFHKVERECEVCQAVFINKIKYYQHLKEHKAKGELVPDKKSHKCEVCHKVFPERRKLIIHRSNMHRVYQTCEICDQTFSNKVKFYRHMKDHEENGEMDAEALLCLHCWKTHTSREELEEHMKTHENMDDDIKDDLKTDENGDDSLVCPFCLKGHTSEESLEEHLKTHDESEPRLKFDPERENRVAMEPDSETQCPICWKFHKSKDGLAKHMLTHDEAQKDGDMSMQQKNMKVEDGMGPLDGDDVLDMEKTKIEENAARMHVMLSNSPVTGTTCKLCAKSFKSEKHLKFHMRHHKIEPSPCNMCGKTFRNKRKLADHQQIHKVEPCTCSVCGASFQNKITLYGHMKNHKVDPCVCEFCNMTCKNKKHLCNHKYTHHYMKGVTCKLCDLPLTNQTMHEEHMNTHHKSSDMIETKKEFENVEFKPKSAKTYACEMCGKLLKTRGLLRDHLMLQHDQKIECEVCAEEFGNARLLRIHKKHVHNIVKKYEKKPCEVCGKMVHTLKMKKHLATHDENFLLHECETCNRKFKNEAEMGSHICKHFACDECDLKFVRNRNLRAHKLEHQGIIMHHCDQCEAMFKEGKYLRSHKKMVHEGFRKYACTLCEKKFAGSGGLKDHVRVAHTGEKPYKCEECGARFGQKSALIYHRRLHTNEFPVECDVCHQKFRMTGNLKKHKESKMCGFTDEDLFRNNVEN